METLRRGWFGEEEEEEEEVGPVESDCDSKVGSAWTMVPGTMLICSSCARDWYFWIQIFQSRARAPKTGE